MGADAADIGETIQPCPSFGRQGGGDLQERLPARLPKCSQMMHIHQPKASTDEGRRVRIGGAMLGKGAESHESIVDQIYEAAAFPGLWPVVLDRIARASDAAGMVLLANSSDLWRGSWSGVQMSPGIETAFTEFLKSDVPARTQATPRLLALDRQGFISERDIFTPDEWEREPHCVDWSSRWGFHHAAATAISIPSGEFLVFHLERKAGKPAFGRHDLDLLDQFRPHLARAGLLAARWRLERLHSAVEALAAVGLPALVLEGSGRVIAANRLVDDIRRHLAWLPQDRLALVDSGADAMLRQALGSLGDMGAQGGRSFPVRSEQGAPPVVFHLVPTLGRVQSLFDGATGILLATKVAPNAAPELSLIRGLFDLTPGEARVTRAFAEGLSLNQIADLHGVSRETIRSQLKAVFLKTGTRRQAELAALLSGIPSIAGRKPVIPD